jgi:hypothetical protein
MLVVSESRDKFIPDFSELLLLSPFSDTNLTIATTVATFILLSLYKTDMAHRNGTVIQRKRMADGAEPTVRPFAGAYNSNE